MNIFIKHAENWFKQHPKARQWAWFATLWFGSLLAVIMAAYPLKWLIKSIG